MRPIPTRRQFLVGLGAAGLLAACGDGSDRADAADSTRDTTRTGSASGPAASTREIVTDNGLLDDLERLFGET